MSTAYDRALAQYIESAALLLDRRQDPDMVLKNSSKA